MIKEVETADVVVTNPTHVAVALKYALMQTFLLPTEDLAAMDTDTDTHQVEGKTTTTATKPSTDAKKQPDSTLQNKSASVIVNYLDKISGIETMKVLNGKKKEFEAIQNEYSDSDIDKIIAAFDTKKAEILKNPTGE